MADRQSSAKRTVFSASAVLEAVGADLALIKSQDGLTWHDVAAVLGVSDDMPPKYAEASASMSLVTFARGSREWNGRFTGSLDRLCADSRPVSTNPRECESKVLQAALSLSIALADGDLSDDEIRTNRATLENAKDAIGELLDRLQPRAA
jgi:hypothetical protein